MPTQEQYETSSKEGVYLGSGNWKDYIISGRNKREFIDLDDNIQTIKYILKRPEKGTWHSISSARPQFITNRKDDFPELSGLSPYEWKSPVPPMGDWTKGSEYKNILWSEQLGEYQLEIITEFVSLQKAERINHGILSAGLLAIAQTWFNSVTFGYFWNSTGAWVITSVKKVKKKKSGNTGAKTEQPEKGAHQYNKGYQDWEKEQSSKKGAVIPFLLGGAALIVKSPILGIAAIAAAFIKPKEKTETPKPKKPTTSTTLKRGK